MKINIELPPVKSCNFGTLVIDNKAIKSNWNRSENNFAMLWDGHNYEYSSEVYNSLIKQCNLILIIFKLDNNDDESFHEAVTFIQAAKDNYSFPIAITELPNSSSDVQNQLIRNNIEKICQLNCPLIVIPTQSNEIDTQRLFQPSNTIEDILREEGDAQHIKNALMNHSGVYYYGEAKSSEEEEVNLNTLFYQAVDNLLMQNDHDIKSANNILVFVNSVHFLDEREQDDIKKNLIAKGCQAKISFFQAFIADDSQVGILINLSTKV